MELPKRKPHDRLWWTAVVCAATGRHEAIDSVVVLSGGRRLDSGTEPVRNEVTRHDRDIRHRRRGCHRCTTWTGLASLA